MKILSKFNKVTLNNGKEITPVKVEFMLYTEESKTIEYGFLDSNGELVRVGGKLTETRNFLEVRITIQNQMIDEAQKAFN